MVRCCRRFAATHFWRTSYCGLTPAATCCGRFAANDSGDDNWATAVGEMDPDGTRQKSSENSANSTQRNQERCENVSIKGIKQHRKQLLSDPKSQS